MYRYIIVVMHVTIQVYTSRVCLTFVGTKQPLVGRIDYYVVIFSDLVALAMGYILLNILWKNN